MFARATIFAITALVMTTNGAPATTCTNTVDDSCPSSDYELSSACECCPKGDPCDEKFFGQFCLPDPDNPTASQNLDVLKLPLSCTQRQSIQTQCSNTCKPFEIRQDTCECCPLEGYECTHFEVGGPTDYCDADSKLIKERLPFSCPQKFTFTAATCTTTCATFEDQNVFCDCCPNPEFKCDAAASGTDIDGFKAKYCNGTAIISTAFAQSCPLPVFSFDTSTCATECIDYTYRAKTSCDCCPFIGEECINGDLFCTNNEVDPAKIPIACGAKIQQLCDTFCPMTFTIGANCDCCPIVGYECDSQYYGQFCDTAASPKPDPSKIPDGCPTKDLFLKECKDAAGSSLVCPPNTFKTTGCGCCPVEGKECDPSFNGAYCNGNVLDISRLHQSCPQRLNFKDCSLFTCPADFTKTDDCLCCPPVGFECDNNFCDTDGLIQMFKIPMGCPQQVAAMEEETECNSARFLELISDLKENQYVNTHCQICPVVGTECEGDNQALFCLSIAGFNTPDYSRIPSHCPQVEAQYDCPATLYTKNLVGECCPLKGKEGNAEYKGKYSTPDGKLIYANIPAGCPQYEVADGCPACSEGYVMPSNAQNCECCPFRGFECDKRYDGKFCDLDNNLIFENLEEVCRPSQTELCDARYYFTGKDGFTCCPFEGKECSPVYGSKYCSTELGNAPWRQTVDPLKIPQACKASSKSNSCSSRFVNENGLCCPLKGYECTIYYDNDQFCTDDEIDYSKIPFGCSQFEDVCTGANFKKVNNQDNTFKACCPNVALTQEDLCTATTFGAVNGKGGLFCGQDGEVLPEVIKVCSAAAAAATPETKCGDTEDLSPLKYTFIDAANNNAKVCCPLSGFECIGANKDMYCDTSAGGKVKSAARLRDRMLANSATFVPAECPNNIAKVVTADVCNLTSVPGKDLVIKQDKFGVQSNPVVCAQCPYIGKECTDETNFPYTNNGNDNDYCTRVEKVAADQANSIPAQYEYTLNIMKIDKLCPQRINGFSKIVATHFEQNAVSKVYCPTQFAAGLGLFYSTFANPGYSNPNLIDACNTTKLGLETCAACPAEHDLIKTGSDTLDEKCICCPKPEKNICDPIFNNKYCLNNQLIPNALPKQCLPPSIEANRIECPKGVACGAGWVDSSKGCDCCPDLTNYTDTWCQTATASELSDILCSTIGTNTSTRRPAMDVIKLIPSSCTMAETIKFPLVPLNNIVTRTGVQCPRIGTECDSSRVFQSPNDAFCKVDADFNTVLNVDNIPVGCDQKTTNTGVCPVDACERSEIMVPDKDFPTEPQYCQCCPKIGFECDSIYDNKYCDPKTNTILYDKIPSSCDQQKSTNACNFEFFFKDSSGSCCPIEGRECLQEFGGFFCDEDGTFKKFAFEAAKCDVPKCSRICEIGYIQNGCYCCPIPFFELDEFYNGAYTGFDGLENIPEECLTLNLFPQNPWDIMSTLIPNDFENPKTVEGLLPVGTLEGYKYALNVMDLKDVFEVNTSKPAATLENFMSKNIDYKINWATKGRVFGVTQVNQIYTILNTPAIVTNIDAEIDKIEAVSYVALPTNIWEGLGVKDQAEFKLLSEAEKRYKFVTFWFNKPINECSKFGQQDRFYLGETNWLPTTLSLDTAKDEYTLSKLIEELTYPKELTVEALLKVTKSQNISMTDYLQLDKVNRAYRMVKANLPATFDAAWHQTNAPTVTINTFETFLKSSVYWFDAKYPGLQIPPAGTGETTAIPNAARAAVYASYMGKIEPANAAAVVVDTTDSSFSNTFEQYRMDYYMGEAVKEYVIANPSWDPYAYALKYSDQTLTDYVYPAELKQWLSSSELNKIMDMVREAEGWLVKYAAQLPTLSDSFKENVLGSVLDNIGINLADIQATADNGNGKYSFKQALFLICAYLDKNGQTLSDVYVPEYPATDLAEYYLSNAVIEANNFSTRDIDFIYQGAKLIEADLLLDGQLAKRNADLLVAFDGSAEKLAAATDKEKAGRLMYVFYKKTRATLAKEVSGVIKPQPFSRYFYPLTEAAVKTGFTNAKVSERDLYTGRENAFSIALKVQTETFKEVITQTGTFITDKYPLLKAKIDLDTSLDTTQKKAEAYAYFVATADIGLRPKPKSQLDRYFPGASQSYLTRAKISEQDFYNIDQKVTNSNTALFRFNSDLVTELGITAALTGADAQEIVFRVNAAREYAEERIAYYENLYKLHIVDHLRELGVTADMLSEINLSFDQVADNPEQWNTELIGNMLFSQRYGKICKPAPVYVTACQTGWQSPLAVAEITIPLGLTQQIAMTKQYSLLEVMQLSRQYVNWTDKDARQTNNIEELAKLLANDELDVEFVKNYFDGEFLSANDLVTRGYLCEAAAGTTGQIEKLLFTNGPKVCDYLSNPANGDVFRDKSRADTIVAPKTNIDIMRNSFHKQFTEANFLFILDAAFVAANGGSAAVDADYSNFGNFIKAAAQFPAFCSVEDNKKDTVSCEKQIIGLLAVVGHYSSGFKDSLSAATTGCDPNKDNSCLNVPPVETLEYHYISKLMNNSEVAISDAIYKAWGMGQISGPREFLEFFSKYPEVATDFTGFTKPAEVRNLLTEAPEMNWATAFYRWFQPSKVNFEVTVTESQDIGDGAKKYFYVEDSYLVPSFDTLMLGNFGDFLDGANDFTTMFPTSQNGFRGIMKVLLGGNCHLDAGRTDNGAVVLAKTDPHTKLDAMFTAVVANWKIKDTALVVEPYNENKDCSAVGKTSLDVNIPNIPKFNRKNYYAPTVTTVEPAPFFTVRQFQGSPGQCFNVHIETPYSIFSQDAYARCVAVKMLSNYGQVPAQGAAFDFSKAPDFTYYF